jgi:hypothetical protein
MQSCPQSQSKVQFMKKFSLVTLTETNELSQKKISLTSFSI